LLIGIQAVSEAIKNLFIILKKEGRS